jgi:hypothetical protein
MMPLGSMLGGWLATFGLSVPLILGGGAATLVSLTGIRFITKLGNESTGVTEAEPELGATTIPGTGTTDD